MQPETVMIVTHAALYNLWNMVPWFIIKQTQTKIHRMPTHLQFFAQEWFHKQTNME